MTERLSRRLQTHHLTMLADMEINMTRRLRITCTDDKIYRWRIKKWRLSAVEVKYEHKCNCCVQRFKTQRGMFIRRAQYAHNDERYNREEVYELWIRRSDRRLCSLVSCQVGRVWRDRVGEGKSARAGWMHTLYQEFWDKVWTEPSAGLSRWPCSWVQHPTGSQYSVYRTLPRLHPLVPHWPQRSMSTLTWGDYPAQPVLPNVQT